MKFDFASLDAPYEADWPVNIPVPQDGGKIQKQKVILRFRTVPDGDLIEMGQGAEAAKAGLRAVVVGFGKAEEQTFSPALLDLMLERAYVRLALIAAYGEFALGQAAEKN